MSHHSITQSAQSLRDAFVAAIFFADESWHMWDTQATSRSTIGSSSASGATRAASGTDNVPVLGDRDDGEPLARLLFGGVPLPLLSASAPRLFWPVDGTDEPLAVLGFLPLIERHPVSRLADAS